MSESKSGPFAAVSSVINALLGLAKQAVGIVIGHDDLKHEGEAQQDKARAEKDVAKKEAQAEAARAEAKAQEARQKGASES